MQSSINHKEVFTYLKSIKYKIGFFLAFLVQTTLLFKQDIHSTKFLPMFVGMLFITLTVNLSLYAVFFLAFRKKEFYRPAFFTMILSAIAIYIALNYQALYERIGVIMNTILVEHLWPFRFVKVSLIDGNLLWTFMLALYIGIFLMIYGNWFVRHKKLQDGFWKIERQLMYTGLGLYGVLAILVFIFTHFTFVGSNYMYIENSLRYVDKIVDYYDDIGEKENFAIKDLKYFNDVGSLKSFYGAPIFKNRVATGKNKIEFYNSAYYLIEDLERNGFHDIPAMKYEDISRFHDWLQISYNLNLRKSLVSEKKLWYTEITPTVLSSKHEEEEVLRHSVLYIKQGKSGGYYAYFTLDRTFKDHKVNYIYNLFFVLFHVFYIGFFIYLLNIHRKNNLSKKYKIEA